MTNQTSPNLCLCNHVHLSCYNFQMITTYLTIQRATAGRTNQKPSPGASCHLHASVKSRITLKIIHDNAMVTTDDMLVDALPAKMLKDFVDAINAVQNCLESHKNSERMRHTTVLLQEGFVLVTSNHKLFENGALTQKLIFFHHSSLL